MKNWLTIFAKRVTRLGQVVRERRNTSYFGGKVYVDENTSMNVAAFYRGCVYLATQISKLPWEVKNKDNSTDENSRVSFLLNTRPNPEMNAMTFRLWALFQCLINGNAYAEIERTIAGAPLWIWPISNTDLDLWRDQEGKLWYRYLGEGGKTQSLIDPKNVLHFKNFHTRNGLVGESVISYAKNVLGISIAADRMASGIFRNGGLPAGFLMNKGTLSDEAYARMKEDWESQYGADKQGGTALLEEGTEFKTIDIDPQVLQFLESRKFGVLEIARYLNIPPTKLYAMETATYSNVENANLEVVIDTLDAWARMFEAEADTKLLNDNYGGKYTELDLYSVFRGDMNTRGNYFKAMMSVGAISPNEIRRLEGKAGYSGGDRYFIATNNYTPADRLDEVVDAQISKSEPKPAAPAKDDSELNAAATKLLEKMSSDRK